MERSERFATVTKTCPPVLKQLVELEILAIPILSNFLMHSNPQIRAFCTLNYKRSTCVEGSTFVVMLYEYGGIIYEIKLNSELNEGNTLI